MRRQNILVILLSACLLAGSVPAGVLAAEVSTEETAAPTEENSETQKEDVTSEESVVESTEGISDEDGVKKAYASSGKCGENLTWTLDDEGTLTISGKGDMYDYGFQRRNYHPWSGGNNSIFAVVIKNGVTSIGNCAFCDCLDLIDITIPDSVTRIGEGAFYNCSKLTSITIPGGVIKIEQDLFYGCDNLTSISMPESMTSIGNFAFSGCSSLTSIKIPKSVTSIGGSAFSWCSSLVSITIPDGVTSIEVGTFYKCRSLTNIVIPDSVKNIEAEAFDSCSSLTSITIPKNVKDIDEAAFYGCNSLEDVYYSSTESEWNSIDIGENNDCLTNATLHCGNELIFDTDVFGFKNYVHKPSAKLDEMKVWEVVKSASYKPDSCYPHITQEDFKVLIQGSPVDKQLVEEKTRYTHVGGHCFGMSTAVILNKIHAVDSLGDNYNIRSASQSKVCSKICLYHIKQFYSINQERRTIFINSQPSSNNNNRDIYDASATLRNIESKVSSVKDGGIPVRISFCWWYQNPDTSAYELLGHTVVGYGVEQANRTIESTTYTKCILVYDPNIPNKDEETYIYYNDNGDWYIPFYTKYSDCSSQKGAFFIEASNTLDEINCKGTPDNSMQPLLTMGQDQSLSVKNVSTGKSVTLNPSAGPSAEAESGWKSFADITDSESAAGDINYIIPGSTVSYTLVSNQLI